MGLVVLHLVSDYRAMSKQIERVPGVWPDIEAEMGRLRGTSAFATLELVRGAIDNARWVEEARGILTIAMPKGLFVPARVL